MLQDFITLLLGLVVEAFPFVILGVIVSGLVGVFLTPDFVIKILPKNKFISHFMIAFTGIFMPVCECGNVPVARRLVVNGFTVSQAMTFLLAAPIINPITLWSTAEAFGWESPVVFLRIGGALVIAVGVGLLFSLHKKQEEMLSGHLYEVYCQVRDGKSGSEEHAHDHGHGHSHDHSHDHHDHHHHHVPGLSKWDNFIGIIQQEFMAVMPALIIGAVLAAGFQVFIPRSIIVSIGSSPILSVIAMLILALVVSICANVDAFFALSYSANFTLGSIMTFLVFGPMIDIKILTMLSNTFKIRVLIAMATVVTLSSVVFGLLVNLFY